MAPPPVVAEADVVAAGEANGVAVVDAEVEAGAGARVEIAADAFKLAEVTTLVQDGTIESAAELELAINDPEADINRVDIDPVEHARLALL